MIYMEEYFRFSIETVNFSYPTVVMPQTSHLSPSHTAHNTLECVLHTEGGNILYMYV